MSDSYDKIKNDELHGIYSDWSFSDEMYKAARNSMWRNKDGLWLLLSAACDEAASKCYEKINKFSQELIDIDTCNIHTLKSIAESVDFGYLCKHIREDYPDDVIELMNLLSIPKKYFMDSSDILTEDSTDLMLGKISKRSALIEYEDVPTDVIYNIIKYCSDIKKILNYNLIFTKKTVKNLLKTDLNDLKLDSNDEILELTLNQVINEISKIKYDNINQYKKMIPYINGNINYFYILINVIKQNFYNEEDDFFIQPQYFNSEMNIEIDLRWLFVQIINTISSDNEHYIKDFICYHFYNLILSKLQNNELRSIFTYVNSNHTFYINEDKRKEYSLEDFEKIIQQYLNEDEIEELLNPTYNTFIKEKLINETLELKNNFTYYLVEFVKYAKFLNEFIERRNKLYNETTEKIKFNVLKFEYPDVVNFTSGYNDFNYEQYVSSKNDSVVMQMAKEFTDITLNISYTREQIKTSIQQLNFIGTRRIATDIFTDFFIKNYCKDSDMGYISNINEKLNNSTISSLLSSTIKEFIGNENVNDNFSVDVIEYYDDTNYLNIESDLGNVKVGTKFLRTDVVPKYFIDSNNLIASAMVSSNVYTDVYLPCSNFISDFSKKFWKDKDIYIGENTLETLNETDYHSFYEQFIECDNKENYILTSIIPLLSTIWDTFALSGFDENYKGDYEYIFKKYIGQDSGENKYKNLKNKYFPTIVPIQNIEGLRKVTDIDSENLLFLAKIFYSNVENSIIKSTKEMLRMHNEDGVPYEDWRQKYVDFHGYSTFYEYAKNINKLSNEQQKIFEFDGPWSYSKLNSVLSGNKNIDDLIKYTDVYIDKTELSCLVSSAYNYYLNEDMSKFKSIITENIFKIETDVFDNVYTLMKNNYDTDENLGLILFRESDMPISLPIISDNSLYDFIDLKTYHDELYKIFNNCVDFGIHDDYMWVYGKIGSENYDLVTFKFENKNNHIIIDTDTVFSYEGQNGKFASVNDLINVIYNKDDNSFDIFTFDSIDELYKLSNNKNDNIGSSSGYIYDLRNLPINIDFYKLYLDTNKFILKEITVDNSIFPIILSNDDNEHPYDNTHSIWKMEEYKNLYYICYEALNPNIISSFEYYRNFNQKIIKFETLNGIYEITPYYVYSDKENKFLSNGTSFDLRMSTIYEDFIYSNKNYVDTIIEKLQIFIGKYPICEEINGKQTVEMIPIMFSQTFDSSAANEITKNLFSLVEETNNNVITFDLVYENISSVFNLSGSYDEDTNEEISSMIKSLTYIHDHKDILSSQETSKLTNVNLSFETEEEELKKIQDFTEEEYVSYLSSANLQSSYLMSNDVYDNIEHITDCINDRFKIIVWFKNDSGISFIHDYALDLDLTCYINDDEEKNKRVGYGNGYKRTRYISWDGDVTKGEFEYLDIDVQKYIKDKKDRLDNVSIVLGTCWHYNSELMSNNVYITISYRNIKQDVKLDLVGLSKLECNDRSIIFNVDLNNGNITYEYPKIYLAAKLTLKQQINGYDDGIPDVQIGTIDLTKSEYNRIKNAGSWIEYDDYFLFFNKIKTDTGDNIFKYITILFKEEYYLTDDQNMMTIIRMQLEKLFNKEGYVYNSIKLDEIFFGYYSSNKDSETGINYIFYSFFRPKYFKKSTKYYKITEALNSEMSDMLNKI